MPHANIWIRKENLLRWEAIDDKSAWVNTMLGEATKKIMSEGHEAPYPGVDIFKKETIGKDDAKPIRSTNEYNRLERLCKNGHILQPGRTKCSVKDCKYA